MINPLLNLAIEIQQIPAPTFDESLRGDFIEHKFQSEGDILKDIHRDEVGNILARLPGTGQSAPLVISAHMDTVFPKDTVLTTRHDQQLVYGPGIGDNSMGVAALFGVLWGLRERNIQLPGDIWFVANTCEEGLAARSSRLA